MDVVLKKVKRVIQDRGVLFAFKHSIKRLADLRRTRAAVQSKPTFSNVDQLLDFSLDPDSFIRPFQVRSEIKGLLEVVQLIRPKVVMEIGTANGGTLFMWTRVADEQALLLSLDLPAGHFGDGYPAWKAPMYRSFALPGQKIELLRDDSHAQRSLDAVKAVLNGRKIDFLFIDGDHSYEGVKKDFEMYSPFCRAGAVVGFHDVAEHEDQDCKVRPFWLEIRERYQGHEFIGDPKQGWGGIGYIKLPQSD